MHSARRLVAATSMALSVALSATAQERPTERVSPPPLGNPNAVVWRTPEPPADPQKCDVWANPLDGMEMVYIPPGEFLMGSSNADLEKWLAAYPEDMYNWFAHEQPQGKVKLKGYWIGRTEVTNAQYARFVEATGRTPPEHWRGGKIPEGLENFPVVYVEWEDARAYCAWAGGRLPSEPEWERAARGGDGRTYPWGFSWDRSRCRNFEAITGRRYANPYEQKPALDDWSGRHNEVREGPVAVGSYPNGASPFGCLDMAGNVWEWCADWYDPRAYARYAQGDLMPPQSSPTGCRVLRGGAFNDGHPRAFRCALRHFLEPFGKDANLGFRCARDASR